MWQMLYDICGPKLYANCLIGDLSSLVVGIYHHSALIDKIERLHLYSGRYLTEPNYDDLLNDRHGAWMWVEGPPPRPKFSNGATEFSLVDEFRTSAKVQMLLARAPWRSPAKFPRLRIVCFGDIPNCAWGTLAASFHNETMEGFLKAGNRTSVPKMLLDVPSVEHVCQSTRLGPHAFDFTVFNGSHAPLVFNWHPSNPSIRCPCMMEMGPMILGATNRYFFTCLFLVENVPATEWDPIEEIDRLNGLVLRISRVNIIDGHTYFTEPSPPEPVDLGDTKLEIYDYVRYIDPIPNTAHRKEELKRRACGPATSLARIQDALEKALPECWKGRVTLKNREDTPPCTACGVELKDMWEQVISTEGAMPGVFLPCEEAHKFDHRNEV